MLQKVRLVWAIILLVLIGCKTSEKLVAANAEPVQIQVLATLHKFHLTNPNYSYEKVTQLIKKFDPDIIAVEIRLEDLQEDSTYLAQFYPLEMRQVLKDFPREKVRGLDWYGNEAAGKTMAPGVFKNEQTELGKIKKLERELNQDSVLAPKLMSVAALGKKQAALAKVSSPAKLNNGEYDKITDAFYQNLEAATHGTRYQTYTDFNRLRDQIITENIVELVKENPGKRIIILVGANHRSRAVKVLQQLPSDKVKLVPVED